MSIDSDRTRLTAQIGATSGNTADQRHRAQLAVAARAHDTDDARQLLAMLGLDQREENDQ